MTLTCGGLHIALEFCNWLILPYDIFSMHLPYSEMVRNRKDRFITNVIFENIPFIFIKLIILIIIRKALPALKQNHSNNLFVNFFS